MTNFDLAIYVLKFMIPSLFSILFRAFGLGYRSRHKLILGLVVFTLYLTIVPAVLITVMGYGQFTHIVSLVMTLGAMAALIFTNDPPGKTILMTLIIGQMNTVVSVPLNMVRHLFHLSYLTLDILLLLVCALVYLVALRFWAKPLRFIVDNMHVKLTAPMLIPIVTTAIIYAIPVYPTQNFANNPIYCTVLMMAVELVFFLYIYTLYRSLQQINILSEQKLDAELLRLSAALMAERLHLMDEAAHQSNLAAHDRRHFNSMLLELLEQGQSEQAAVFLRQQTEIKPSMTKRYCDNIAVNAIICYYTALAKDKIIAIDIKLDIPNQLVTDSLELAMAVSNLLENAIHACERVPQMTKKHIRFTCHHVGRLVLEISNPCTADTMLGENGYPSSSQAGHGMGTKSVIAFTTKYDGELFYRIENNVFTVRLLV